MTNPTSHDPHPSWAAEARALEERSRLADDQEIDRLAEQVTELHVRIVETLAKTLAGVREQLVVADQILSEPDEPPVGLDALAVRNALGTLDRLLAEGGTAPTGGSG